MEWFNLTGKLHQIKIALPAASVELSRRFLTQPRPAQPVLNWGFKAAKGGFAWGRHLFNKAKTVVKKTKPSTAVAQASEPKNKTTESIIDLKGPS